MRTTVKKRAAAILTSLLLCVSALLTTGLSAIPVSAAVSGADVASYARSWVGRVSYYRPGQQNFMELQDGGVSDCSWFVYHVMHHFGLMSNYYNSRGWGSGSVPGTVNIGTDINKAVAGDVLFWDNGDGSGHVVVYVGDKRSVGCNGYFGYQGKWGGVEETSYQSTCGRNPDSIWHFTALGSSNSGSGSKLQTTSPYASSVTSGRTYVICSAANPNYVLDIDNGSTVDAANLRLWTSNGTKAQAYTFTKSGSYFLLLNVKSGRGLSVSGGSAANGANIYQFAMEYKNSQKWKVQQNSDGTFTFLNANSGLAMDITGGTIAKGTNIWQYTPNGSAAQKWFLLDVTATAGTASVTTKRTSDNSTPVVVGNNGSNNNSGTASNTGVAAAPTGSVNARGWNGDTLEGTYYLVSAKNTGYCVDISGASTASKANVQLYVRNNTAAQRFVLYHIGGNYFTITNVNSGKALDVAGGVRGKGVNVWQYNKNRTNAQYWRVVYNSDGTITFVNALGYVLDISGGTIRSGSNIQTWTSNGSAAQKWYLVRG